MKPVETLESNNLHYLINKKLFLGIQEEKYFSEYSSLDSLSSKKGPSILSHPPNHWLYQPSQVASHFGPRSPTFPAQTNGISLNSTEQPLSMASAFQRRVLTESRDTLDEEQPTSFTGSLKSHGLQTNVTYLNPQRGMPIGVVDFNDSKASLLSGILPSSCMSLDVNISGSPVRDYFISSTDQLDQDMSRTQKLGYYNNHDSHIHIKHSMDQQPQVSRLGRYLSCPNVRKYDFLNPFNNDEENGNCELDTLKAFHCPLRSKAETSSRGNKNFLRMNVQKCRTLTGSVNNLLYPIRNESNLEKHVIANSQQNSCLNLNLVPLAASSAYSLRSPRFTKQVGTAAQLRRDQTILLEKRLLNQKCHAWLMDLDQTQ